MSTEKIRVGITHGDINGIGYEIIFKAFEDPRMLEICTPIIYGSSKIAAYHRKALNIPNLVLNNARDAADAHRQRINIINCLDDETRVELGKPTPISGHAALVSLQMAVADLKKGAIDVLVTAPINKSVIQSDEFKFPGHTEYLQQELNGKESLMFLVGERMRVGVVTGHIPLNEVAKQITVDKIMAKLRIMHKSLKEDFAIRKPKIAVLGLNPHAGDDGLLGNEEKQIIIPAIEKANSENILAFGPYAADGFFGSDSFTKFDAVLAMYHDQGLIPFKAVEFINGVNFTAGLSAIRTSPDHGTAFEIAGLNQANHESFLSAIYLAIDVFKNRAEYKELTSNPLQKYEIDDTPQNNKIV